MLEENIQESVFKKYTLRLLENRTILLSFNTTPYSISPPKSKQSFISKIEKLSSFGHWYWDILTNELEWSDEVFRIFGEEPQSFEPNYERFQSYLPTSAIQGLDKAIQRALESKENYYYEHTILRSDGSTAYLIESGEAIFNSDGVAISMLGTVQDITGSVSLNQLLEDKNHTLNEQIKINQEKMIHMQLLEQQSQEQFSLLQSVINTSPDLIYYKTYTHQDGLYLGCNDAFCHYVGKNKEEIINHYDQDIFESKKASERRRDDYTVILNQKSVSFDEWLIYPNSDKIRYNTIKTPLYDKNKELIGILVISRDITARIENESLIKENSFINELLLNYDQHVIASKSDLKGIITYVSSAFCKISGYSKEELIGKPHNIIRHPDMQKSVFKQLWSDIKTGKSWKGNIKNLSKQGYAYWVKTVISPIVDKDQNITGYSAIGQDITAQKELEVLQISQAYQIQQAIRENRKKDELLAQQNRLAAMGEMLGNIAHQWKQPLNTLSILSQKIKLYNERNRLDSAKIEEIQSKQMLQIEKMSSTIDDFRNFFRPDKKGEYFSYYHAIDTVSKLILPTLNENHITLKLQDIDPNMRVYGYFNEFTQVLLNIINNAKDAIIENQVVDGIILLFLNERTKTGTLSISDNAGGIPSQYLSKVFEPYFTTKLESNGTGIGLYMSKMIIEDSMNGKLNVYNTINGACFHITLNKGT
jgi:PAS domain S-box-containing protein